MQRWKLIIIFTRPGDNYRPTERPRMASSLTVLLRGKKTIGLDTEEGTDISELIRYLEGLSGKRGGG